MKTDKTSQKLILIISSIVIFYSQVVIRQRPESNFMDAQARLQRGIDLSSEEEFQKAIKLDPTNPDIHYKLAGYYTSAAAGGRFDMACSEYKKAILFSSEKQQMDIIKYVYSTLTQDYLKLQEICSGTASSELMLGRFFMDNKRYDEAVDIFKKSIELAEKEDAAADIKADAYAYIGKVHFFKEEFDKAIENLAESLKIVVDRYWVLDVLGWAYLKKEDLDKAKTAFEKSIINQPDTGWACYGLAVVYERQGLAQEAKKFYKKALRFGLADPVQEALIRERLKQF